MIENPYKEIIDGLIETTKKDRITWVKTSTKDEYRSNLPSGSVTIWVDSNDNKLPKVVLETPPEAEFIIFNNNGEEVHRVKTFSRYGEDFRLLETLHDSARQSYIRSDATISGLLSDLATLK